MLVVFQFALDERLTPVGADLMRLADVLEVEAPSVRIDRGTIGPPHVDAGFDGVASKFVGVLITQDDLLPMISATYNISLVVSLHNPTLFRQTTMLRALSYETHTTAHLKFSAHSVELSRSKRDSHNAQCTVCL